jgi:hypothetical protein
LNVGRFLAAEAEAVVAQADFDGVPQWGEANHFDLFPFEQAHFQQALNDGAAALQGDNPGTLTPR